MTRFDWAGVALTIFCVCLGVYGFFFLEERYLPFILLGTAYKTVRFMEAG